MKTVACLLTIALRLAPLLLVIEGVLVMFAPPIVIFGFNPLREWLAGHIFPWLGHNGYHLAGAITDFKKIVLYACFYCQLLLFKAMLQPNAGIRTILGTPFEEEGVRAGLKPTQVDGHRRHIVSAVSGLIGISALVFVGYVVCFLWLRPTLTDHVFGPVGKGLLSSWRRHDITLPSQFFLVAYRAWYIMAASFVGIIAAATVYFSLLRAVDFLLQAPQHEPKVDCKLPSQWLLAFCGTPLLTFTLLCLLLAVNNATGIGELSGQPLDVALAAVGFLITWIVVAAAVYVALARRPAPPVPLAIDQVVRLITFAVIVITVLTGLLATFAATKHSAKWGGADIRRYAAHLAAKDVLYAFFSSRMDLADEVWKELGQLDPVTEVHPSSDLASPIVAALLRMSPSEKPMFTPSLMFDRQNLRDARPKLLWEFRTKLERMGFAQGVQSAPSEIDLLLRKRLETFDSLQSLSPPARRRLDWVGFLFVMVGISLATRAIQRRRSRG